MAVAVTAVTIFSCNNTRNSEAYRLLADVEKHVWDKPDSALLILQNIDPSNLFSKELESEYDLYQHNSNINSNIETLLMMPKPENISISSSSIKEFLKFNCDISKYVPMELVEIIKNKYNTL